MSVTQQSEQFPPRVLIFLLSSVGLIVLPHAWNLVPVIFATFAVLWAWRFIGVWKTQYLPSKALLFLLTCVCVLILFSQHQGVFGRDAGTGIFVIALGLKLLEIKTTRELYLTVYFAFLIAATLFLYQQSLFMAAYIIAVCLSLLATLCAINSRIIELSVTIKIVAILLLQSLPLCVVLFVLFPRLEAPHWAFLQDKSLAKSGLSDTLEPGSISELGLSDELVFRVKFSGPTPPSKQLYWRGPVFSHTDGKRWTQSPTQTYRRHQDALKVSDTGYQYTLLMEPQAKAWVFALDMPTAISPGISMNADYQLTASANPQLRAEYTIKSYPRYNTGNLHALEAKENTQLPAAIQPEITGLVERLHGFDSSADVFIQQVLDYFRREQFYYSLTPPLMEEHPIETFLFKTRTGFCSHYATAFVYLMRVAHIPARVVGGYQGGQLNAVGNFLEVRQADAHAWAEVWLQDRGWVRVDPTAAVAPERVEHGVNIDMQIASGAVNFAVLDGARSLSAMAKWAQTFRQNWQNIDYSWQRWVINYNTANQARFLSDLGLQSMAGALRWMMISIATLTLMIFVFLMRRPGKKADEAVRLYQKFCHQCAKLNLQPGTGETASAFATRVITRIPAQAAQVQEITAQYLYCRYGRDLQLTALPLLAKQVNEFRVKAK